MKTIGAGGIARHPEARLGRLQARAARAPGRQNSVDGGRREEDPVAEHDVVQQVAVAAGEGEDDRPDALEDDRGRRRAVAGCSRARLGKKRPSRAMA